MESKISVGGNFIGSINLDDTLRAIALILKLVDNQNWFNFLLTNRINLFLAGNYWDVNIPCTPFGIEMILKEYGISVLRKKVLIIGHSKLVGEPLLFMMNKMDATTIWANSYTPYETLKELCLQADIIISCAGRRNLITQDMVTPMTVLIDVGINVDENGKLCGDAERSLECFAKTPVPGGVGPMTITALLWNCV